MQITKKPQQMKKNIINCSNCKMCSENKIGETPCHWKQRRQIWDIRFLKKKLKTFFLKRKFMEIQGETMSRKNISFQKLLWELLQKRKKNVNPSSGVKRVFLSFFTGEIFGNKYKFDIRLHDFLSLHTKMLLDCYRQQLS